MSIALRSPMKKLRKDLGTMKILLVAVNAKYIHSNLAVRTLRAFAVRNVPRADLEIEIGEYTINQQKDDILRDIYERTADMICFSCYIWNRAYVEALVRELKKICPHAVLWLGGPEVSYDAKEVLLNLPEVTGVMRGEGERTFAELCEGRPLEKIAGITFRGEDGAVCENEWREPVDLDEVPFIYEDMDEFRHKIIYYETSRGCPFSCSYCLSSVDKRLRFRSISLVKKELEFFLEQEVSQVKFVDRTFNCSHSHAMEIWKFLLEHDNGITNFHFEISADLLNEEELALIKAMRPGLIQLEIGVQSTNERTIREIRRTMDMDRLTRAVNALREAGNVHQHLDLIAGLPYEDIESFSRSFDDVYRLKPHQLQLGFLKVLKGSYMEERMADYGLVCKSEPPYEVLYTKWLSYKDVLKLKGIEEMVEVYYNSRQFEHTLTALERLFASPFRMYERLWEYYRGNGLSGVQHKRSARYEILLDFVRGVCSQPGGGRQSGGDCQRDVCMRPDAVSRRDVCGRSDGDRQRDVRIRPNTVSHPDVRIRPDGVSRSEEIRELLIYDYYLRENAKTRPDFAGENPIGKDWARKFYEEEEKSRTYLPGYEAYDKNQMRKMTHLEYFPALGKTMLFDYMHRNPLNYEARTCEL